VQPADAEVYEVGVQSLFAILSAGERHRRLRIGRKRMPRGSADRFWARVERVGSLQHALGDRVDAERYTTKTRGERYQPGALPIAHGEYAIVRTGDGDPLRFSYSLEAPAAGDDELPRVESASHALLWKRSPRARAVWTTHGEPSLLDREGTQIVLVGARPPLELQRALAA
jgi:hypothetical protein